MILNKPMFLASDLPIAVLQFNPVVGDLVGNAEKIVERAKQAYQAGARLVVTPELALSGYPAEDLLIRPGFIDANLSALRKIVLDLADLPDLHLVIGHPDWLVNENGSNVINAASYLHAGRLVATYAKRELPNYQVFDERRYFQSGRDAGLNSLVIEVNGWKVGVLICEDAWFDEPAQLACSKGAQVLLVLNASPFHVGKSAQREARMALQARARGCALVYAHMVGGQDEVVFDGASFALNAQGELLARAPSFEEVTWALNLTRTSAGVDESITAHGASIAPLLDFDSAIWQALVMGVHDYVKKNRFQRVIIGLSGGIDSALVLALAVDALGADQVRTVMMPSCYTAEISLIDAKDMAQRLKVSHEVIPIMPMFNAFRQALAGQFENLPEDMTEENIQARVRGTLLMALSNKFGAMVLTTGNKSEMATGYCTLYGDMAGGFAVIKDVMKTTVYRLAQWRNELAKKQGEVEPIPQRIIDRPPSAELRPDQTDQDSLPPYDILDAILVLYMEQNKCTKDIIADGFQPSDVEQVVRLIKMNEYKRRQAPIGVRITQRAFGRDWRYPVTSRFLAG